MKSFYEVLEIPEWASTAEIRSAYLRLAREYHPDRVPEHLTKLRLDAEEKFKKVQEAWAVLGDPFKRRQYDLRVGGESWLNVAPPPQPISPAAVKGPVPDPLRRKKDRAKLAGVAVIMLAGVLIAGLLITREAVTRPVSRSGGATSNNRLPMGVRQYNTSPRHIETWPMGGGAGLDVQLLSVTVEPDGLELSFRVRSGERGDLLLYEPPRARDRTRNIFGKQVAVDRAFEEIYIQDDTGAKFYSTTGLIGGQQINFNIYNFTRRINFRPREEVRLAAKFPPISSSASSITFVSPGLAKWQPEWRWPTIDLK
jgi:DnaJ domain